VPALHLYIYKTPITIGNESPPVELFIQESRGFVETSPEEELGKLVNLVRNSFEPILVYDGQKYLGSISLQNTVFNSRLAYKSRANNNLATNGSLTFDCNLNVAITQMIDYGWLRVPVFNQNHQIIGQISAKNILQILSKNPTFLNIMVTRSRTRLPLVLSDNALVEDAYFMLKSKRHARLYVLDKSNKYLGTVTKSSLAKAFNKVVESKRFSTKKGSPVHNIYVGEKPDRDDHRLTNYIESRVLGLTSPEGTPKEQLIKKLVKSKYDSIVILDADSSLVGFLSLRDLLRSVLFQDTGGDLNLIIRGFDDFKKTDVKKITIMLVELSKFIQKSEPINKLELSNNEIKSAEGKTNGNELMLRVDLYSGKSLLTTETSRDLFLGLGQLIDEIKTQFVKSFK
jgi:CBS domain-containing protein